MQTRRYDVDWLRVIVMVLVLLFHSARFFGGGRWHLVNDQTDIVAVLFVAFLDLWFMPFFFLLSGFGTWYSLRSRNAGQFLKERAKRILIPLYTAGLLFLLPPQYFFEMSTNSGYSGGFWDILPDYFSNIFRFNLHSPDGLVPLPFSGHLWFLQFLFLISLFSIPLLLFFKSENSSKITSALANASDRWGGIFLFIIPIAVTRVGLRSFLGGEHSWAGLVEFILFFVIGFIFASDERFSEAIQKSGWAGLLLGLISFGVAGYFVFNQGYNYPGGEAFSLKYVIFECVMSVGRWGWIVFVLSIGAKYLNFTNKFLKYCNEAVLPFYLIHQTIILGVGWFVITWETTILQKFVVIFLTSFIIILALYDILVRRINFMRFLFGMSPKT